MIWGFWREKKAREMYSDLQRHLFQLFRTNRVTLQSAHSSGGKLNYSFRRFSERATQKIKLFEETLFSNCSKKLILSNRSHFSFLRGVFTELCFRIVF